MLGPQISEDDMILDDVTIMEALTHFATIGWKFIFAIVPPSKMGNGVPSFVVAISLIGVVTAIVGEVATILGCVVGLKEAVTGITLVALGTSLPDTFASMTAAQTSEYADSAVGNVTGSNSVNVFLGLGLPWVIAATFNEGNGDIYEVPAGDLAFSVFLFLITSTTCFIVLILRRKFVGGELGGTNLLVKNLSAAFLVMLWLIYIIFSSLKAYGVIE
uniref:Sodium/calcium exchanger membrane region domain-containing protein n=1 Tax=Strombidium inclinatum TaxID=197538 RepID=A0A7S3MX74_9SPIT|mmetsp:Transcript_3245/g.4936  ORF Transcript_3245/g.4936 Transcript_3245/m.4936 type:complete len:217 (+) Transcript_3245:743-1393(+)